MVNTRSVRGSNRGWTASKILPSTCPIFSKMGCRMGPMRVAIWPKASIMGVMMGTSTSMAVTSASPSTSAILPSESAKTGSRGSKAAKALLSAPPTIFATSPSGPARESMMGARAVAISVTAGPSPAPTVSWSSPQAICIFCTPVTVAAAVPPTCFSTALKIMSWALRAWPPSTRALILAFSASVKDTPDLARAVMPLTGSWRALPSWMALVSACPKPAEARS